MSDSSNRRGNSTLAWTAVLLGPFLLGFLVVHHLQSPAFRSTFLPPLRWDALRLASAQWPFYFKLVAATALVIFVAVLMQALRVGATSAGASMGLACGWLLLPLAAIVIYETWRAYAPRYLSDGATTTAGRAILLAYPWCVVLGLAGLAAGLLRTLQTTETASDRPKTSLGLVVVCAAIYVLTFGTLATMQYRALHVPHGDTGMYEEHLWNVWHGKGFRSELDSGRLFLGERFQVIHLALLPFYVCKPTLLTLNWLESAALATTALAMWSISRSLRLPTAAGVALAFAALLYFPLQSLDQEQTWKTFRPNSFGVPLVAFALAALERERYRLAATLLAASFLAAEDYALVAAAIGVYLALRRETGAMSRQRSLLFGFAVSAASLAFLVIVLTVVLPYFRGGGAPHYTPYFKSLGDSPSQILRTIFSRPQLVFDKVATAANVQFFLLLLGPLAFLPLASPLRLAAALPTLGYLMLGDREGMNEPFFHFHGPAVAPLLWAAAGGCQNLSRFVSPVRSARFVLATSLVATVAYGPSPLAWKFHDAMAGVVWKIGVPGGPTFMPNGQYWRDRYRSKDRASAFESAIATIQPSERVAATDYIRTRFTHFAACHEYPPLKDHVGIGDIDVMMLDLAEGYWGRGPNNVDRQLLAAVADANVGVGQHVQIRGKPGQPPRSFEIVYRDRWFLVARKSVP